MITPVCDGCGEELQEPGALVFGPPATVARVSDVPKYHVCIVCFVLKVEPLLTEGKR